VDAKDASGWTSLHMVAQTGRLEVAKALLDAGADAGTTEFFFGQRSRRRSSSSAAAVASSGTAPPPARRRVQLLL
jgi:ankyrin repeat protein